LLHLEEESMAEAAKTTETKLCNFFLRPEEVGDGKDREDGSAETELVLTNASSSGELGIAPLDLADLQVGAQPSTLASLYWGFAAVDADEDYSPWSCHVAPALQVHAGGCMRSTEWS
jgi:hypothetical protein